MTNDLCVGRYIYNRTTQKLQTPRRDNPATVWTCALDAVEPVISEELFAAAQRRIASRARIHHADGKMLEDLRALFLAKGRLSHGIIGRAAGVPSIKTYARHFGSFEAALKMIGYDAPFCISGKDTAWSAAGLKMLLRRVYDRHGHLSLALINRDADLPSATLLRKKIGNLSAVYAFAGLPRKSQAELLTESRARGSAKITGRPGKRGPRRRWTKKHLIAQLRLLRGRHGHLSGALIDADPGLPSASHITVRFGTLLGAYRAAGWHTNRREISVLRAARRRAKAKLP